MDEYPQHERLLSNVGTMSTCKDFVEWLADVKGYELGLRARAWVHAEPDIEALALEFLGVDMDRLAEEEELLREEAGWKQGRRP